MRIFSSVLAVLMLSLPCWAGPQDKKGAATDLIPKAELADAKTPKGWKLIGKGVLGVTAELPDREVLVFDHPVPAEYDLTLTVERVSNDKDPFDIGIVVADHACTFSLDVEGASKSWLSSIALKVYDFPNVAAGGVFAKGKPRTFRFMVRKNTLEVLMDGKKFYKTKALDWTEASIPDKIVVPESGKPFLCAQNGAWKISAFSISAVSN